MNLNPSRKVGITESKNAVWHEITGLIAAWIFCIFLISLVSCPIWIPLLVDKVILH